MTAGLMVWRKRERRAENEVETIKAWDRVEIVHGRVLRGKGKGRSAVPRGDQKGL
jgi:hypothetical protein